METCSVSTFKCAIVTPSEQIMDDDVVEVEFPQWDGQRGILQKAAPFVGQLGTRKLRIRYGQGEDKVFMRAGGFAEMHGDRIVLVADESHSADDGAPLVESVVDLGLAPNRHRNAQPSAPKTV